LCRNDWADAHGLRDLQVLAAIDLLGGENSFENISAIVDEWSSIDVDRRFVYAAMDRLHARPQADYVAFFGCSEGRRGPETASSK